jgi:hypothetical protein
VIDSRVASRYRKECEIKKHWIKKMIDGNQCWGEGPDLTAAELATRMEYVKQYDATNDTKPRYLSQPAKNGSRKYWPGKRSWPKS